MAQLYHFREYTLMSVNVPQRYLHIYIYWTVIYNIQDQDIVTHIHIGVLFSHKEKQGKKKEQN